ncbi:MAG: hypothetical protein EBS89_11765 [Proteobacteria bacterium]|nr:hypothetical protein [Pseudomonadota bacterium]
MSKVFKVFKEFKVLQVKVFKVRWVLYPLLLQKHLYLILLHQVKLHLHLLITLVTLKYLSTAAASAMLIM